MKIKEELTKMLSGQEGLLQDLKSGVGQPPKRKDPMQGSQQIRGRRGMQQTHGNQLWAVQGWAGWTAALGAHEWVIAGL